MSVVHVQLVRHGKSVAQENKGAARRAEDMRDAPIATAGRKQAEALARSIESTAGAGKPTLIVASPLTRALQTAVIIRKGSALTAEKIQVHPGLAEHGAGMPENQGTAVATLRREPMFADSVDFCALDDDSSWPNSGGGQKRLAEFARWLAEQPFAHVVAVSHKVTIECLLQGLGVQVEAAPVQNCVPIHVTIKRSELLAFAAHTAGSAPQAAPVPTRGGAASAKVGAPTGAAKDAHTGRLLIVLAGLPGSGKSTFARALEGSSSPGARYVVVSSDEDGKGWGAKLSRELQQSRHHIVLDRVNPTRAARQDVLRQARELAGAQRKSHSVDSDLKVELVYFDVSAEECERRAMYRTLTTGHPTVKAGKECKAVAGAASVLVPPGPDNDGFGRVHRVRSGRDAFVAFCDIRGGGDALPAEIRHHWLGKLDCGRAIVYYPPADSAAARCVRDIQIEMSRKDGAGDGGLGGAARSRSSPLVSGAIAIKDVHITLLSPAEVKAFAVCRDALAGVELGLADEFPEMSAPTTDGVPRLGRVGSKCTAFFLLLQQDVWRRLRLRLLTGAAAAAQGAQAGGTAEEASPANGVVVHGGDRDFHVSFWNQGGGDPHESVGGLTKRMDKTGANFVQMFGALQVSRDWSADHEAAFEKEEWKAGAAAALSDVESTGYVPREVALTDEELRRGNTCRRPCGDVECQFKFPRTFHILDTGNMEADDLLLDPAEARLFIGKPITVEEKVDGANIGISLDPLNTAPDGKSAFRFQKRAHFVTVASEAQFRGLDTWADENRGALLRLLQTSVGPGKARPGQRIVFGEWLAATHSKAYDSLPSRFILFDLFDAELREGRGGFLSARNRDRLLACVNARVALHAGLAGDDPSGKLWRVRAVCTNRTFASASELVDLMNSEAGRSVYITAGDESRRRVEGVYLRVDDEATGLLRARTKLVHPDFHRMLAEGRWEGGAKNAVRHDLWWGRDHDAVAAGEEEESGG